MAADKATLQEPPSAGKLPRGGLGSPAIAQWAFISILVVLFGLSRTGGALGTFLRSFSTFLFP